MTDAHDAADARVCAAVHDEDQDGLDDLCDPCPHLADTGVDSDGDGVGDACDPQPAIAKQRIAFFDSFATVRTEWMGLSNMTISQDQLRAAAQSPQTAFGNLDVANAELSVTTGGTVSSLFATTPHSLAISFGFNNAGANYHYVQFYDNGGAGGSVYISKAEGGSYPSLASTPYAGTLPLGAWRMQFDESVSAQQIQLASTVGGQAMPAIQASTTAATMLTASPGMTLLIRNADITLDYFIAIETIP